MCNDVYFVSDERNQMIEDSSGALVTVNDEGKVVGITTRCPESHLMLSG